MALSVPETRLIDLMPPAFEEGLDDWSTGNGTPDSRTYEGAAHVRLVSGDGDFGACLEMRKIETVQRLRYMAELPIPPGACIEISARLKVLRGPRPGARIAIWPGGPSGQAVSDLPNEGPITLTPRHGGIKLVRAVIGPAPRPGIDLVWDGRAVYAHVGLDLVGPDGGVVRIERIRVREVSESDAAPGPCPGQAAWLPRGAQ
ncbi:hypothetical protein BH23PSE1_BH23PSE1_09980 [soil metagenome]